MSHIVKKNNKKKKAYVLKTIFTKVFANLIIHNKVLVFKFVEVEF